jgi:hypothetical protein
MEYTLEIIKIVIPALLVFLTALIILRNTLKADSEKRRHETILQGTRAITPIKLQAYERIVLFLERISLESLIMRVSTADMNVSQLQSAMLTNVRSEFEHNLSQQIYMSPQAWEMVKNARSGTIKMINNEADKIRGDAPAIELSKILLSKVIELEKEPSRAAIDFIKGEVGRMI